MGKFPFSGHHNGEKCPVVSVCLVLLWYVWCMCSVTVWLLASLAQKYLKGHTACSRMAELPINPETGEPEEAEAPNEVCHTQDT